MKLLQDQSSTAILFILLTAYSVAYVTAHNEGPITQESKDDNLPVDYRLPMHIIPTKYEIILMPQLYGNFTLKGIVHINAYVQEPTDTITLHHGNMKLHVVTVSYGDKLKAPVGSTYNNETEKFEMKLDEILNAGTNITINMEYSGVIRDDMVGFYRSSYVDVHGNIRWMFSTQFQKDYARHAFPCFDEPKFKASFTIRILRSKEYACLSNMPLNRSVKVNDQFWDEFKQSIPMSTYLVAFVISDFKSVKLGNFSVWARPNAFDQTKYALSIGTQALDHLAKRFDQNYQIAKMDMVAVPDFSMGAMENWGLVTFRESRLLYSKNMSSDSAQQSIASVIVHELTHMWFGNTMTPEWWSYLWLSEAFARYFEYFGTAQIEQTWNMEEQFIVAQHQTALNADGVETSQPLTRDVSNSSQMDGIADTITYNKGGSIVRMMNLVFGSEIFDMGLRNYLKNEDKAARPKHLWNALQNEVNRQNKKLPASVEEIMTTWTEQPGFPVVKVSITNGTVTLKQERFLLRNLKSTPTKVKWWIPIIWATKEYPYFNITNVTQWFSKEEDTINIGRCSGWVIFNIQSTGFYRVNYDNDSWYRIIDALNSEEYTEIHVLTRATIVDDLLNLARTGLLSYVTAFDGLRYLTQETNYLPFKAAFSGLTYLDQRLSGQGDYYNNFKEYFLILINNIYKKVGYVDRPNDDRLTVLLRGELSKWACNYGHPVCVATSIRMFQQWKQHNITIKPNQRPTAYCMGIKYGTENDWNFLWNQYYHSNSPTEQVVIMQALGCTENTALLEKYLSYALQPFEESRIRMQDNAAVFSAVYGTGTAGAEFVLNFVAKHYENMIKFYNGTETISSILSSASQRFSTQSSVNKFENLIEERKVEFANILKPLKNALDIAKYELQWLKGNVRTIMSSIDSFNDAYRNNSNNETSDTTDYRLPSTITPDAYSIWIATNLDELDDFQFEGSVKISASVAQETQTIVLHSADLRHRNISVSADNKHIDVLKTEGNQKYDFLTIELGQKLLIGQKLIIAIEFTGNLNEDMRGFYKSYYVDENQETRWLAATHMEPIGARKMFPCFDEPALKAKFRMSVRIPEKYSAINNMPIENFYLHSNHTKTIIFGETPKMSTYLVALVVSDFVPLKDDNEVYGVWARKSAIYQGQYALSVMQRITNYYGQALGIPYQLPKLDMVALPDFVSGAMENWGLLTYKERNVLYDSELSTTAAQQSTINVISHEITHQWFGNLVSPLWWKYLWLNEGFARYFQFFGTSKIQEDWSLESQFVVEHLHSAFEADSVSSTHAMTNDVYSPAEIHSMLDTITYAKAASVIRMVEKLFGREVFFKSLGSYLKKRQYDVATPEDLFDSFKEQIVDPEMKNSIHDIMNSWSTQPGFPVIHVTFEGNQSVLKQERYFRNPEMLRAQNIWNVPITWTPLSNPNFEDTKAKYWLKTIEDRLSLPDNDVYLINVQQTGFYRTNYDTKTWHKIIDFLKSDKFTIIHEINRAVLIDDLLNLGRSGHVDYSIVLAATQYLEKEKNYIPWRAFFNGLTYLHKQFEQRDAFTAFKRYVTAVLTPIYNELGFSDQPQDSHVTKLLRSHVRSWACKMDVSNCRSEALRYFETQADIGTRVPANYRSVSYCIVAQQNDPYKWQLLWDWYITSNFAAEKSIILQALACTTDKKLLTELLTEATSNSSSIRFEDSSGVFTSVANASPDGLECVMDFVKNNYEKMVNYYRAASNVNNIVTSIGTKVYTSEHYVMYIELLNWLEERKPASYMYLQTHVNIADYELQWAEENIPRLNEWLEKNYPRMDYRLPKSFSPLNYSLHMRPFFETVDFQFFGNVQIEIKRSTNYVSHIVLHSLDLDIKNVSVYSKDNSYLNKDAKLEILSVQLNNETQTLSIFMKNFIKSDIVLLDIDFEGTLNDNMIGFYRSHYKDSSGRTRWLATTQFQATYARKAFPCFDEPALKATFAIYVEAAIGYTVLSNMPQAKLLASDIPGRSWFAFKETPKISTYLVAFIVSDFKPVLLSYGPVNVWGRLDLILKGDMAAITATRALDFLYLETGHHYTLPKLDLVGIPDFEMGGMENWGLATFSEYGLSYKENHTSAKYLNYILTIISHELAHMLYGDLVTCDWWEYLWLNEGFAEYMQWRLSHLIQPSYGFEDIFVVEELQSAMQEDNKISAHPMNHPVNSPAEIENTFDGITYGKSASVIRMIHKSFNSIMFRRAMYLYLLHHQFNTATPKDLWQAFDDAIKDTDSLQDWNITMGEIMDGWTNKKGYPIVDVSLTGNYLTLSQRNMTTYEQINAFVIPITLATKSTAVFVTTSTNLWLTNKPLQIYIKNPQDWVIVNIQQTGYYRVNYDRTCWLRLFAALQDKYQKIHVTNRAQIIDDLFNLALFGHVQYDLALNGTRYLQNETSYIPWKSFFNGMDFILQRYAGQTGEDQIAKYIHLLASKQFERLGFTDRDDESHLDQMNRDLILSWLCKLEQKDCVAQANKLFKEWRDNVSSNAAFVDSISPNSRAAVYCTAIRHGSIDDWKFLWQKYLNAVMFSDKNIILNALGCSKDKEILNSYLELALTRKTTPEIRKQDVNKVFASIYNSGKFGVDTLLDFLVKDYKRIHEYYDDLEDLGVLISKLASVLSTREQISKLYELLLNEKDLLVIIKPINSAIATATDNLRWYQENSHKLDLWMSTTIPVLEGNSAGRIVPNTWSIISTTLFTILVYVLCG